MINADIRKDVFESGITYRKIAQQMNVTPEYLCRIMSVELSEKNRERIRKAIDAVKKQ